MVEKLMLFTPGPVMTSKRLKAALAHPDLPHRRPAFEQIVERNRANLLNLFGGDERYAVAIISASGTGANETALSSIVKPGEEVLLLKNGEFGNRLDEILTCYYEGIHRLDFGWGNEPDLALVEKTLAQHAQIGWVCMVYHETSTGMINPVQAVGALVERMGRKYFVDCVSALGGQDINLVRDHIDVATSSANKAISGTTGISFVCAKRESVPALGDTQPRRNIYLNLQNHLTWADKANQTPNTPAVTMFIALDAALQELNEEGLQNRIRRYAGCAAILRAGLRDLGLRLLLPEEKSSNTLTTAFLPEGVDLAAFIERMEARGYVLYPGKGQLYEEGAFQIANMGWITPEDCHHLLQVLKDVLGE